MSKNIYKTMKIGNILGVIGIIILFFVALLVFKITAVNSGKANQEINNNFGQENIVIKDGIQEVLLEYKKYPNEYKFNYYPEVIELKNQMPVKIIADDSLDGCFATFNVPELGISHSFYNNKILEFTPTKTGTFSFSCPMSMGGGKLVITE